MPISTTTRPGQFPTREDPFPVCLWVLAACDRLAMTDSFALLVEIWAILEEEDPTQSPFMTPATMVASRDRQVHISPTDRRLMNRLWLAIPFPLRVYVRDLDGRRNQIGMYLSDNQGQRALRNLEISDDLRLRLARGMDKSGLNKVLFKPSIAPQAPTASRVARQQEPLEIYTVKNYLGHASDLPDKDIRTEQLPGPGTMGTHRPPLAELRTLRRSMGSIWK